MTMEARWTGDELVRRVAVTLAGPAYTGAPNGRVRDLPDRRAVRWYVTIGLVDRPAAMQGRTALYGTRHLLQIVAVKRRQAEGRSLAEIQAELAGATDETLRRVASVPDELIAAEPQPGSVSGLEPPQSPVAEPRASPVAHARPGQAPGRPGRFWADPPTADGTMASPPAGADSVSTLAAIRLSGGALLVLPRQPDDDDFSAIHAAARPLLDLLADRGLLTLDEWSPS